MILLKQNLTNETTLIPTIILQLENVSNEENWKLKIYFLKVSKRRKIIRNLAFNLFTIQRDSNFSWYFTKIANQLLLFAGNIEECLQQKK